MAKSLLDEEDYNKLSLYHGKVGNRSLLFKKHRQKEMFYSLKNIEKKCFQASVGGVLEHILFRWEETVAYLKLQR